MDIFNESSKATTVEYFAAYLRLHNNKILMILLSIILISLGLALKEYLKLENELKLYNKQELINVLVSNRDIQIGETLQKSDLESIPYPKELFKKIEEEKKSEALKNSPSENNENLSSIIPCEFKLNRQENHELIFDDSIIGKHVKIPIAKGSLIRREHLNNSANDLLNKLIPIEHILLEYSAENLGANKYLQAGDIISLYDNDKENKIKQITNTAKIILVNSKQEALANNNLNNKLELTLAIHKRDYNQALLAKAKNQLVIAINNSSEFKTDHQLKRINALTRNLNQQLDHGFQNLVISSGLQEKVFN